MTTIRKGMILACMTPDKIDRLAALVAAQPPGRRVRFHPSHAPEAEGTKRTEWDTSHDVSRIGPDGTRYRIATYRHADDAAFADEACNALRDLLAALATKDAEIAGLVAGLEQIEAGLPAGSTLTAPDSALWRDAYRDLQRIARVALKGARTARASEDTP